MGARRIVDGERYAVLQYASIAVLICLASAGLTVCVLVLNRACATSSTFGDLPLMAEHWLRVLSSLAPSYTSWLPWVCGGRSWPGCGVLLLACIVGISPQWSALTPG